MACPTRKKKRYEHVALCVCASLCVRASASYKRVVSLSLPSDPAATTPTRQVTSAHASAQRRESAACCEARHHTYVSISPIRSAPRRRRKSARTQKGKELATLQRGGAPLTSTFFAGCRQPTPFQPAAILNCVSTSLKHTATTS